MPGHSHVTTKKFFSLGAASLALAQALDEEIRSALSVHDRIVLTLPGGSTPITLFQELAKRNLPWDKIMVTLSDERFVANTSTDSNERALREHLLQKIFPPPQFIPLVTDQQDSAKNLANAEERLKKIASYPNIILIGMGIDGHITSLFSKEDLSHTGSLCITLAPNGMGRISLTLPQLIKAQKIFLLIAGKEKIQVLKDTLHYKNGSPISALIELAADKIAVYSAD